VTRDSDGAESPHPSVRLYDYAALTAALVIGALVCGRPELVCLAAPFALALVVALARGRPPAVQVALAVERERALEGETLALALTLHSDAATELDLALAPDPQRPGGLVAPSGQRITLALSPFETRELNLKLRAERWGAHRVPGLLVRSWGPLRLLATEQLHTAQGARVRVYPRPERLAELIAPAHTRPLPGARVARARGDGLEPAEVRPFVFGDRARAVNWRATARLGTLHVNQRHPERSADVVLLLDSFEQVGATLDQGVRACLALAEGFLAARDRVGVIGFGGVLRWLEPSLGERARYRIADALIQTEVVFSYVWRTAAVIPPRLLPAGALVVGVSPLLDDRAIAALGDLRARGYDVAVFECSPEPFVRSDDPLAQRLWLAQREMLRERLRGLGVAVASWRQGDQLAGAVGEVIQFRRRWLARARA
jgi:uncharacterized protein (DUF58 family)